MENTDNIKKHICLDYDGIYEDTKDEIYEKIVKSIEDVKDTEYVLLTILFIDDKLIMSISVKDWEVQKSRIREMINEIADNTRDKRISVPITNFDDNKADYSIHMLYHRHCSNHLGELNLNTLGGCFS